MSILKNQIKVIQADRNSIREVSAILTEAAEWLVEKGEPLWPQSQMSVEALIKDFSSYYLCQCEGRAAGTFRYQLEDSDFWPEITDENSSFIHKLAIRREFAGAGVSTEMLEWAAARTRALGREFLRIDFDGSRPKLKQFYEEFGFIYHSQKNIGGFLAHRYVYKV